MTRHLSAVPDEPYVLPDDLARQAAEVVMRHLGERIAANDPEEPVPDGMTPDALASLAAPGAPGAWVPLPSDWYAETLARATPGWHAHGSELYADGACPECAQ